MKIAARLALSICAFAGLSMQASAAIAPPPLKPVTILPSSGGSQPLAKPVATKSPEVQRPVVKPQARTTKRVRSVKRVKTAKAMPKASRTDKLDRSAVIFNKCVEIEKLSKRKSAVKCLDRFLDRMDIEVGDVETRIMNCGELRRLENFENGEVIRSVVVGEMNSLRAAQKNAIELGVQEIERVGGKVGPRKLKEIELRTAEAHSKKARKLADLVCSKVAFEMFMERTKQL